ncbi:MAG: hypothetical protein C0501_03385 [Isosphaera sp.]|nr:hypothetical protein [Isosphaera sp.]
MFRPALAACLAALAPAGAAADPLQSAPRSAQLVLVADHPRRLAEAVTGLDAFKTAQTLPAVGALYDTTTAKRLLQLLAFAEKELGAKWPELLDQLGGGGVAVAARFLPEPAPAVLILSGTDEKQAEKAFALAVAVIGDEIARQGGKDRPVRETVDGVEYTRVGKEFHAARVGATILVANDGAWLREAVERTVKPRRRPLPHPAREAALGLLPKDPLAWAWVDLASLKQTQQAKDFFEAARKDIIQLLLFGAAVDSARRSDFFAAGLYREKGGFRLAARLPAGRDGMGEHVAVQVPPAGTPGTLPPLDPPGTIYSHSVYVDAGYLWKNRDKLTDAETLKEIEAGEKQISKVLPSNVTLGDLLAMWGPHHRVVVANHTARPYKTEPGLKLPAFGYVVSARDPKFGPALDPVIRSAALLGTVQFGLKSSEHEHEGVTLTAYRFPENKPLPDDPDGIRFNFEPCFAVVGGDLVVASTVELGKKLVTEVKTGAGKGGPAVLRGVFRAGAAADALAGFTDPLVTDAVLARGVGLAAARKEVADLVAFAGTLGTVTVEIDVTAKEYRADVVWTPGK